MQTSTDLTRRRKAANYGLITAHSAGLIGARALIEAAAQAREGLGGPAYVWDRLRLLNEEERERCTQLAYEHDRKFRTMRVVTNAPRTPRTVTRPRERHSTRSHRARAPDDPSPRICSRPGCDNELTGRQRDYCGNTCKSAVLVAAKRGRDRIREQSNGRQCVGCGEWLAKDVAGDMCGFCREAGATVLPAPIFAIRRFPYSHRLTANEHGFFDVDGSWFPARLMQAVA